MHPLVLKSVNDVGQVVLIMTVDTLHARVILWDTVVRKHLHAFPLKLLHRICRPDL